ncbi:Uncharacterized ABC transporter ATP-binding protein HI_1252 [Raoultella terrigena]|uniref:Uncharacterized ABC transporter ATP-binding protein HI_1252 n=1 Tax=Raoultella terrigena TaxID=577 RepID=A0A4U9D8N1_RAOTE|nr:Uncharacterized ABC transporter ATP-binding protein HI_1252 [Raoultella terrigena]
MRGLSKSYSAQQTVLDDISFDLHAGELVGVIGRSGAGKSTLLHVLNGTHSATSGEIPQLSGSRHAARCRQTQGPGAERLAQRMRDDFPGFLPGAAP